MLALQFSYAFVVLLLCFLIFSTGVRWWVVLTCCTVTGLLFALLYRFSMKRMGYWGTGAPR